MIDLEELRDAAEKAFPRDGLAPPRDEAWQRVAELGWLMIELAEDHGGLGLGPAAGATILFEQGRVLGTAPLIPALLGLKAVAEGGLDEAARGEWVERICGGEYVPVPLGAAHVTVDAAGALHGRVEAVLEGDMASHVALLLPDLAALVPVGASGVSLVETPVWDESRRLFTLQLDGLVPDPALVLARGDAAQALAESVTLTGQIALAADALGGANALLDMTIEYLKLRKQFDRPLAMFQALKHRVADCKIKLAAAEALLWARAGQDGLGLVEAGGLRALATQAYADIAEEAVQLHGGIGLTQEYPCHLYLKRAFLNRELAGSVDDWNGVVGRAALERLSA
jgi:alkylation response protein AidB-like acyl-CoA dehydrogenase